MKKIAKIVLCVIMLLMLPSFAAGVPAGEATALSRLSAFRGPAFDRAFYSEALPLHEITVAMSRLAISKTKDPSIWKWADESIRTLTAEIEEMRLEVEKCGGVDMRLYAMTREEASTMMREVFSARRYIEQMIRCSELTIETAKLAPGRTEDARLLELAGRIIHGRSRMLEEFKAWSAD